MERAEGTLGEPCASTMDAKGWIYALENGTAFVHVFDEKGKPVRVMKPEPTDTPTQDGLSWIVAEPDGRVRYCMGNEAPVVTFDAEGMRIGIEKQRRSWEKRATDWEPVRGGGWEVSTAEVRRVNADGTPGTRVRYRPDGPSLVSVPHAAAATDGSIALLSTRETPGGWLPPPSTPGWLCVYGAAGQGRGAVKVNLPMLFDHLLYDGKQAFLSDYRGVTVVPVPLTGEGVRLRHGRRARQ